MGLVQPTLAAARPEDRQSIERYLRRPWPAGNEAAYGEMRRPEAALQANQEAALLVGEVIRAIEFASERRHETWYEDPLRQAKEGRDRLLKLRRVVERELAQCDEADQPVVFRYLRAFDGAGGFIERIEHEVKRLERFCANPIT
jgi:hypothetical protein